ncbi:Gfo/Idh/MocA family protein [Bifidobacterium choloepi]|nr:Gfo/Idh/MocA family oxidoreductase [Bifidobacterium choloepi]
MTKPTKPINVAILGPGRIAVSMAQTLVKMAGVAADDPQFGQYAGLVKPYAVASRSQQRADEFAKKYGFEKAYGSYEAMLDDPSVDLVYIATPHSLHAEQGIQCMEAGKNILVEKAFTANLEQAERLLDAADNTGMLCTEAIWTRYMPSRLLIDQVVSSGEIGDLVSISSDLSYVTNYKERLTDPSLAGGALLDVGVYCLNFADMIMGAREISRISTCMVPYSTGVDASNSSTLIYDDDTMVVATSSMMSQSDRTGRIFGTKGYVEVENINNPGGLDIYGNDHDFIRHVDVPAQLTGYEYEVAAAANAVLEGRHECPEMTHADTLRMMALMDSLRKEWGLKYPFEQ